MNGSRRLSKAKQLGDARKTELIGRKKWSHQDSNLDLEFRKLLFYPLNYETLLYGHPGQIFRGLQM